MKKLMMIMFALFLSFSVKGELVQANTENITTRGSVTSEIRPYQLSGNHFVVDANQVPFLTDAEVIRLSGTESMNFDDFDNPPEIVVENRYMITDINGTYEVYMHLKVNPEVRIKVYATVIGNNQVIVGTSAVIYLSKAKDIKTPDDIIQLLNVRAYDQNDVHYTYTVNVNYTDFLPEVGKYNVYLSIKEYPRKTLMLTIEVIDDPVVPPNYNIYAEDFSIHRDNVAGLTDNAIIQLAAAKSSCDTAYCTSTIRLKENTLQAINGVYTLVFYIMEDPSVEIEVKATVFGDDYLIEADDIIVNVAKAQELIDDHTNILTLSNARASLNTPALARANNIIPVSVKTHTIEAKEGEYDATIHIHDQQHIHKTIKVTVTDEQVEVTPPPTSPGPKPIVVKPESSKKTEGGQTSVTNNLPSTGSFDLSIIVFSFVACAGIVTYKIVRRF